MNWLAAKIGTVYQKPAHAIGLSAPPTSSIGCVLDLPGLPGAGNKIYDRSPYGNHGTITGATWKRLPSGLWVLDFDGEDDKVVCAHSSSLCMGTGDFTLLLWFKTSSSDNRALISKGAELAGGKRYQLIIVDDKLYSSIDDDTTHSYGNANTSIVDDIWHLGGISVDRSGNATFFVDGSPDGTFDVSGTSLSIDDTNDFNIATKTTSPNYLDADIALIRAYKGIALSALEIQNHYQQEKHLFAP